MKFTPALSLVVLAATVNALPNPKAAAVKTFCGQWDNTVTGTYTLYNNLWGESAGSGSQCTSLNSVSGSTIACWSWSGGSSSVKSYANVVTAVSKKALSSIKSLPSVWSWTYTGSSIVADVSYDLFTSSTASGANEYEIMIWLGALGGAGPISSTGQPVSKPTLANKKWNLYKGPNGSTTVFSFVAVSPVENFNGDLMQFLNFLIKDEGLPASQVLTSVGAGTEPFTGQNAVFTTSKFSLSES
ncbi:glycoside hydrolase family 12 protein [Myriangium duriaei CBS 260.36]|uniref:Glycoside hydrolase family 12 protein n=1 Tax=Myriangium duriaei CBS 260.36 TaxID=1168546 RepID=A0A9P4IQW2_9PEZI|nr:glycoside hydrolase family 12 protein [Myriangium duriaei CBS 260.36]